MNEKTEWSPPSPYARHVTTLPYIPRPQPKPSHEELLVTLEKPTEHLELPKEKKPVRKIRRPRYNQLYDSFRTVNGWRYIADAFVNGTFTPTAGSTILVPVTLAQPPQLRVMQWPNAKQAYWSIHVFCCAPQTVPATVGALEVDFQDNLSVASLGIFVSTTGGNQGVDQVMRGALQDSSNLTIGNLLVTLQPGGASPVVYNWSMTLGLAYLNATEVPYEPDEYRQEPARHEHRALSNYRGEE